MPLSGIEGGENLSSKTKQNLRALQAGAAMQLRGAFRAVVVVASVWSVVGPALSVACTVTLGGNPYPSIQAAVNAAPMVATIQVDGFGGVCNENVLVPNTLLRTVLLGSNGATIAGAAGSPTVDARVKGFMIQGFSITGGNRGVHLQRNANGIIDSVVVQHTGGEGIVVSEMAFAVITNSAIQDNPSTGVLVKELASARIGANLLEDGGAAAPNTISGNGGDGISLSGKGTAQIIRNTISDNAGNGIRVAASSSARTSGNVINGNRLNGIAGSGRSYIALGGGGATLDPDSTTLGNGQFGVSCSAGTVMSGYLNPSGALTGVVSQFGPGSNAFDPSCPRPASALTAANAAVLGHFLLKDVGLWLTVERRGAPTGFYDGELIQNWNLVDSLLGTPVSSEASLQLDRMKAMGVNTITFELRAADPTYIPGFVPPICNIPPVLGLQFPQPTATELANLPLLFDMVQSKGMKVWLVLNDTHMEQQPPTDSQTWLGAILRAIGAHPALDLVLFGGNTHETFDKNGNTTCGVPAEAPLWQGPGSVPATYVQWALGYANSLGIPWHKLSAEAIVGDFVMESNAAAGSGFTGSHQWSPVAVEKTLFDSLNVPAGERTYVISFYEHRKCSTVPQWLPCTDLDPHDWADQTLQHVTGVAGTGPRIVAVEMGDSTPVDQLNWNTQHSLESLGYLLQKYGIDGGAFWRWTSFLTSEDSDPTLATPVKQRGTAFVYNPVQKELLDMGGFHLPPLPNGSFEGAVTTNGVPASWSAAGNGSVAQYLLTQEAGQPEVPSRGTHAMRIVTGSGADDAISATSQFVPAVPSTLYTTTSNLRFAWTGDPNPSGAAASRPQVFVTISYYQKNSNPSAQRAQDTLSYFEEDSTSGFATFPFQYATPADATFVSISFGARRNGLPSPITLDVDNIR